jgi:hypothetical protein
VSLDGRPSCRYVMQSLHDPRRKWWRCVCVCLLWEDGGGEVARVLVGGGGIRS